MIPPLALGESDEDFGDWVDAADEDDETDMNCLNVRFSVPPSPPYPSPLLCNPPLLPVLTAVAMAALHKVVRLAAIRVSLAGDDIDKTTSIGKLEIPSKSSVAALASIPRIFETNLVLTAG